MSSIMPAQRADGLVGHGGAPVLSEDLEHLDLRTGRFRPLRMWIITGTRAPGHLPRERFSPLALSWRNVPCVLKAAIGIGKQTLGHPASLPRQRGRSKGYWGSERCAARNGGVGRYSLDEAKAAFRRPSLMRGRCLRTRPAAKAHDRGSERHTEFDARAPISVRA
jgi:hypothetical protein